MSADATFADVIADLETGRTRPLLPAPDPAAAPALRRAAAGGRLFLATLAAARATADLRPALAQRLLARLWFTPWVHPRANAPVGDLPRGARPWQARVAGHDLAGFEAGSGPTVLLVHGWAGRGTDLRAIGADLVQAGLRVVAPDLPAHGASSGTQTDLIELADVLAGVIRREGPLHGIVAHSLGLPMTVLALAGIEAPPHLVALAGGRSVESALTGFAAKLQLDATATDLLRSAIADRFGSDVFERLRVERDVAQIDRPVLLIHDRDDDEVPYADAEAIADAWPTARLLATDGLGHRRILVDPDVRAAVVAHLT